MFVVSLPRMPLYAYNIFSCIIKKICVLKIDKTTYNLRRGVCIFLLSLLARSSISNSSTWSSAICRGSRACRGGTASILIQLRRRLALLSATHTFLLLPATELRTHSSKSSSWCMKSLSRSRCEVHPPSQNICTFWLLQVTFDHSSYLKYLWKYKNNYDILKIYTMIKYVIG
jgi:hypothetical protein